MNINKAIQAALENHRKGNLEQAEFLYKKALKKQPENPDILHMLGVVFCQLANYDSAIRYIRKALQYRPSDIASAHYNLGYALQEEGHLDEAITHYQKAIELKPSFALPYCNIGHILEKKGHLDEAITHYQKAIELEPSFALPYCNIGHILEKKGQFDQAITYSLKAIQLNPSSPEACCNLGHVLGKKGQFDQAITYSLKAIQLNPSFAEAHYNLGYALQEKGQLDEAITHYQEAVQLKPSFAEAHYNLGYALQEKGQLDEAITHYQEAIQLKPSLAAYCKLGYALQEKGQLEEAELCYHKALQINPNYVLIYNNLWSILRVKGRLEEAVTFLNKALQIDPAFFWTYYNLGTALSDQGLLSQGELFYRRALQIKPDLSVAYNNLLLLMNYSSYYTAQSVFSEHQGFEKQFGKSLYPSSLHYANDPSPSRRLKIGYVSPDFRRHSVNYFIEPVLASHNHERFEVFCYSDVQRPDAVTERFQEYTDQWRNITGMQDEKVAELIREDGIDILVDLAGHTGYNRMLSFARKPAPVQVSWIGYPNTTGLSTIDYRIVDSYTDPPGLTDPFYTEKLLRMPDSFLCYLPDEDSPPVADLPALKSGHITFGSFNVFQKISHVTIALWARILKELPDSCLIMKSLCFSDQTTCNYAMSRFLIRGIDSERVELRARVPTFREHLDLYNRIDIGLDTYPYNGTTTTCDALWMGVPVITLAGNTHASRVGASLLTNVGTPELVAETVDDYISIAVNLAEDLKRLQSLRTQLRDMMKRSPLCDSKRFIIDLETYYRKIWETWCKSV